PRIEVVSFVCHGRVGRSWLGARARLTQPWHTSFGWFPPDREGSEKFPARLASQQPEPGRSANLRPIEQNRLNAMIERVF
ncbi:MAG TPA: hypothetical protein VM165_02250, partial [Planctomycetaceae bacterium]|nr:hypothetical protein [Planctomycetaceae bacterium]